MYAGRVAADRQNVTDARRGDAAVTSYDKEPQCSRWRVPASPKRLLECITGSRLFIKINKRCKVMLLNIEPEKAGVSILAP